MPLQFGALWLACDIDKPNSSYWLYFLIGLIGSIAFFTKQTSIGIWIAVILYLTIRRLKTDGERRLIREILFIVTGISAVAIPIVIFFSLQGALPQFWSAAFHYNFIYSTSTTGILNRLAPLYSGIKPLTSTGLFQISMIGYVFTIVMVLYKRSIFGKWLPLLIIGCFDLPIEIILVSISGIGYAHYYMAMLPVLSLFAGVLFWVFTSQMSAFGIKGVAKSFFVIGVMGVFFWSSIKIYKDQVFAIRNINDRTEISYIKLMTAPDDYVLMWGAESSINFFAMRKSPTRFVYQYPLYKLGYVDETMIEEYLKNNINHPPKLIIDTKNENTPLYEFPIHTQSINSDIAYLQSHYRIVQNLDTWTVYEYIGGIP